LSKMILFLAKKSFSTTYSPSGLLKLTLLLKGLFCEDTVAVLVSLLLGYGWLLVSFLDVERREVFLELFLDDFLRNFMPPMSNLLFSGFFTPTRVSASEIRLVLMAASKGASVAREGERFTSISQGLKNDELLKMILLQVRIDENIIT
jgi:hypothetical protein